VGDRRGAPGDRLWVVVDSAASADANGMTFALADPYRRLASVRMVDDLDRAGHALVRGRTTWRLRLPRPPVDRFEYLFEIEDDNGHRTTIPDPGNPRRARGAFGEKSVLAFPEYQTPRWLDGATLDGVDTPVGADAPLLDASVTGTLWSPAGLDGPAPLLVVHDGPEFAELGSFVRYLGACVAAGTLPPLRAALLAPGERNVWYSANPDYAATLLDAVLPQLPAATVRVGVGVSLGALALLHAHRTCDGVFDGLLLQSGSFFTPDLDAQESGFSGWEPVTSFVASVHNAPDDDNPVPTAVTCGVPEENLANNRRMAETLARLGYQVRFAAVRDAHNYTAWRDALHPHLTDLITSVAAAHAA
jgi:enterochelin esterase-like enzyme